MGKARHKLLMSQQAISGGISIIRGHKERIKEYGEWEESIIRPGNSRPTIEVNTTWNKKENRYNTEIQEVLIPFSMRISDPTANAYERLELEREKDPWIKLQYFYIQCVDEALHIIDIGTRESVFLSAQGAWNNRYKRWEKIPFRYLNAPECENTFYKYRREFIMDVAKKIGLK